MTPYLLVLLFSLWGLMHLVEQNPQDSQVVVITFNGLVTIMKLAMYGLIITTLSQNGLPMEMYEHVISFLSKIRELTSNL